jgi:hypothetical protein
MLLLISIAGYGQAAYRAGALPVFNLNKGIGDDWSLNLKIESRQSFYRTESGSAENKGYSYDFTDISLLAGRRIGLNNMIAAGYKANTTPGEYFHETSQQYTIVRRYGSVRMAYRVAANQVFGAFTPEYIFRYRTAAAIPLSGESIDPGEFYTKFNNEYLYSFAGNADDLEIRVVMLAGYEFNDDNKLEFGLDYRMESIMQNSPVHNFLLNVNWYVSI